MATFRTEFLPPSNRRRCVKGRSSYTDSSDLYLPAAVNQDQNSNGFSQNEDSYIDSVRSDDGEEEDITIDLSAFLNANPLFAQAAFESASENNIASTESSSQFRFTDCKVDPSEIPKAAVTNPLLSVDVNGDSSVDSNITNENIVGPHAAVTFIHDTKENCLSPEKMLINLTNNEPAQSVTLNGEKTVLSPTKKFSRALGLSNPLNKYNNFMKSKDLNKVNEKVFGKYPIVKCEKLDIENFVKNNEIKIRNWPLLQTESKKSNSVYKGTIKRKVNLNKGNLKPKFMKKPINFNKYLIASNKDLANQNISNILGDQPDVSKPIIIKTDSWKPGVTNVSSCVPSFFRPLTKTSLSTSKNVECDLLKLNDKTVGLNVISSPEKKCDIRAKAVATNINKLFNSPKSYPLIAPKPCSSSKVHRKINQEKLLKEVVPKAPVVLKVKDVSSEESASVLKPKDIVLEVMQNVFSSTQSKKFPKKSVKKPTCDLTSGNSIIGSSAFSSILNYNILNGFSENDFEDVSLLYDDNFTDSTQEMSPPSKSLPDKVNVVTEDSGLTPKSIKKAREQKKYKRKKFSDNSPEINSTLSASEYESEDKLEKVKRAVISHEDNTENIKSSTVNISVHSKNFNEPVNKDFETKHVDTSLLFSNFESHISESQDSVSCNKLVSPKIVEQTEVPLSSFNEILHNVNSPVKKCKENDNLVKQETSTSTLQDRKCSSTEVKNFNNSTKHNPHEKNSPEKNKNKSSISSKLKIQLKSPKKSSKDTSFSSEDNVKNSGNSESLIEENKSADIEVSSYLPHKDLKDTMLSSADEIKNSVNDSDSCESLIKENNSTVIGVLPALEVENSKDIRLSVADSVELINKTHSFSNINDSSDILNENLHNIWDVTFDSTVNQTNENEFEETENTLEENIAVNPEMSVENEVFEDFVHEETVIEEVVTMEICDEFEQMSGNPDVSICVDDEENISIPSIDSPEESASNPSSTEDFSLDFGDDLVIPKIEKTTVPVIPEEDVTPSEDNVKNSGNSESLIEENKSADIEVSSYLPHKDLKDTMLSSADEIKNSVNDSDSCESLIKENNSTVIGVLPALEVENSKDIRLSVADSVELINKTHSFSNINDSSDILNENLHNIWDVTFDSTVNQTNENEFEETENTLEENIAVNPEMSVENEVFEDFVHEETVIEEVVTMEICDEFEQMSGNPDVSICVDDEENISIPSIDSPEESASNPSSTEDFSLDFGDDLVIPKIEKTTVPVIPEEDVTPKREIKITPGAHSGHKRKSKPVQASTPSSSRKKNYDPELVCLPFSMGWMREQVIRATGKAKNHQSDVYYFSPEGTKLRSMPDILVYLSSHPHIKLSAVNFTFAKELIYHEPFETKREAKQPSWAKKTPSKALISHGDCGRKIAKRRACSKIGDKSGTCANNVNMSPKVVLQKMEEIPLIYCDSLSYSGGHNVKLYQSKKTCAKPSKSIDSSYTAKSGKVLSSEAVPVAGSSKQVTERPENPPITVKEGKTKDLDTIVYL